MSRRMRHSDRGTILLTTMWIAVILGALVIVFVRSMRVEVISSGNHLAAAQASAIEIAGENYVLSKVDNSDGEADYFLNNVPGEAISVGTTGFFWLIRPSQQGENYYDFGLIDECGKLNLNVATADQLNMLPGMTSQATDSILDWIDVDENVTNGDGAESQFYGGLPEPYRSKNQPIESVEELNLIQGFMPLPNQRPQGDQPDLLFGIDRNRNGVIEQSEMARWGALATNSQGISSNRGIFPFVTVYSFDPNVDIQGDARVNVNVSAAGNGSNSSPNAVSKTGSATGSNSAKGSGSGKAANPVAALQQVLQQTLGGKAAQVAAAAQTRGPFRNLFDFANKVGITSQELRLISDKLTWSSSTSIQGLINVNTAPQEVLLTLPGLTQTDVQSLIAQRQTADTSSIAWVSDALGLQKAATIGQLITNHSYFYSADIVAVSGDGRAFKRVRIVVDARTTPAQIIYRKDLTSYGWPLPQAVRESMRAGRGVGPSMQGTVAGGQQMGIR